MRPGRWLLRLGLGVMLIQAAVGGLLFWQYRRTLESADYRLWQPVATEHSRLLARLLALPVVRADRSLVLAALEQLRDNPALRYAAVFNTQRELLAVLGEPPPLARTAFDETQPRYVQSADLLAVEQPIVAADRVVGVAQLGYSRPTAAAGIAWTGALTLGGLVLSGLLLLAVSRSLDGALARLAGAIDALRRGETGQRVSADPWGATGAVAQAVNALAAQLQAGGGGQDEPSAHAQLAQESRRLNTLLQGIHAVVWEVDPRQGQFIYISAAAEDLLGYPVEEWLKPDFLHRHVYPSDLEWVQSFLTHPNAVAHHSILDFRLFDSRRNRQWLRMIGSLETRGQDTLLAGLLLNVSEEKVREQRIAYLADHDPLTGLINRRRFQEKLEEQIAYNRRYSQSGALLFMDLDQFKYINDTYSHHTGDEYLRQVAQHLRHALRQTDIIGRLGGDEFGIILPNAAGEQAGLVAGSLIKTLNAQEFVHQERRTSFAASLGVVLFPKQGERASDLLAKADSAMYNAKERGRNTFSLYDEEAGAAHMRDKLYWEERIRQALKENRFQLYFQPIVDLYSGQIMHYESLLRMIGDNGKVIAPGAFIGIAERFGLIREIDHWVVANALRTQGESLRKGKPVALTINLSGRHFGSPSIVELIQESTRQYGADPRSIVFEVTETAAVQNFSEARDFIQALREMRYRFALDDFGAGFSSFDYLRHLPIDYVKIDGSFVRNLHGSEVDRVFVKAIADMGRGLGIKTVAEFVENQQALEILRELGVSLGQGYYFARPAPNFQESERIALTQ